MGGRVMERPWAAASMTVDDPRKLLKSKILSLAGVERRESRWGKDPAYFVDGREFVHFHGRRELDIRLTKRLQGIGRSRLQQDSRIGFRKGRSEWITFTVGAEGDLEFALSLIKLAWEGNRKT